MKSKRQKFKKHFDLLLKKANQFLEKIANFWALLGGVFLLAIMLITSINSLAFALNRVLGLEISALAGYEDFISLAIAGSVFMFFPYCQWQKGHVVIDLFSNWFSSSLLDFFSRFWLAVLTFLTLFLSYWMLLGMIEAYNDHVLTPILGWPIWSTYLIGLLSILLWFLVCLVQTFQKNHG